MRLRFFGPDFVYETKTGYLNIALTDYLALGMEELHEVHRTV